MTIDTSDRHAHDEPLLPAGTARQERFVQGKKVLDATGGAVASEVMDALGEVSPELRHQIIAWGYGDIISRPGLEPRERQLVTLGMLTALGGCEPQLDIHIHASLNVGLTPEQIIEALLHSAVYCGFPRAMNATFAAKKVFAARGLTPGE